MKRPIIVTRWRYDRDDVEVLTDRCRYQAAEIERMMRKLGTAVADRDTVELQLVGTLGENARLRARVAALEAQSVSERPYWACPSIDACARICSDADHWRDHVRDVNHALAVDATTLPEALFGGEG